MAEHSTFSIHWEINVDRLTEIENYSPITYAEDVPWSLSVVVNDGPEVFNERYLCVYLHCNWESENEDWKIDYSAQFRILNDNEVLSAMKFNGSFAFSSEVFRGYQDFMPMEDLLNEDNGYISNGKLHLEARVTVLRVWGIRKRIVVDFDTCDPPLRCGSLQIGDRKLYVSKELLAEHSPVFKTTFFGNFEEKEKETITFQGIVYEEFVDLLNVIYPTSFEITSKSVSHILELADRFQVESVIYRVEQFFMRSKEFTTATKLRIAEQYRLKLLISFCVRSFTDIAQIQAIKKTPHFMHFSDTLKAMICERIVDF